MLQKQAHPLDVVSDPSHWNWWKRPAERITRQEFATQLRKHRRTVYSKLTGLNLRNALRYLYSNYREERASYLVVEDMARRDFTKLLNIHSGGGQ